jgi:hypothetical protein
VARKRGCSLILLADRWVLASHKASKKGVLVGTAGDQPDAHSEGIGNGIGMPTLADQTQLEPEEDQMKKQTQTNDGNVHQLTDADLDAVSGAGFAVLAAPLAAAPFLAGGICIGLVVGAAIWAATK